MSTAVIRVKRRINEDPLEAVRLAKRRRFEGGAASADQGGGSGGGDRSDPAARQDSTRCRDNPPFSQQENFNCELASGVVLTFAGTAHKPDLSVVQSVLRRHEETFTVEKDAPERTLQARRQRLKVVQDHQKLLKRFPCEPEVIDKVAPKRTCDNGSEIKPDETEESTAASEVLKIYDALHEDIVVTRKVAGSKEIRDGTSGRVARTGSGLLNADNGDKPKETFSADADSPSLPFESASEEKHKQQNDLEQSANSNRSQDEHSVSGLADKQLEDEDKFVYDIYYARASKNEFEHLPEVYDNIDYMLEGIIVPSEQLVFDEEYTEVTEDDEDSNAEDHPNNDYPDEEDWGVHGSAMGGEYSADNLDMLEEPDELHYIDRRLKKLLTLEDGDGTDEDSWHYDHPLVDSD